MDCQRDLFALPPDLHYLNCAFMAPVSDQVANAAREAVDQLRIPARLTPEDFFAPSERVRHLFARLVNIDSPQRVAIIPSVSYAMATLARNTPLTPGQNVVVVHEQFPSAIYTWQRACDATGATLRVVAEPEPTERHGQRWNDAVVEAVDPDTATVVLPVLHWAHGTRFDLERIRRRAHECGATLIVDGTQSVGALPFDVDETRPDALVCAGYKWLTGPYSVGLAYFGPAYDDGIPIEENWIARKGSEDFAGLVDYSPTYQPGALRYDVGERSNFVLLPMLEAGLTQVLRWRPDAIQNYCATLIADVIPELMNLGCWIEPAADRASHLFGVRPPAPIDVDTVKAVLAAQQVSVSVRGQAVRVAPHVYNDRDDMTALVNALRVIVTGGPTA